jgi:hypothetical protein
MRFEEFDLDLEGVVMAPLTRREPAADWLDGRDAGILPSALFSLYTRSRYLSYGADPPFLADREHILFSYFGLVMQAIKDSLLEANTDLKTFQSKQDKGYDLEKRLKNEPWDPEADAVARRSFQLLLSSLLASLDSTAELVALFLPNQIKNLFVGRAQFSSIESWLEGSPPVLSVVCSPQQKKLEELYIKIKPKVCTSGEETEWLRFARNLRNKSTHIPGSVRQFVFKHSNGESYTFLPREWPFIWEKHFHATGSVPPAGPIPMPELLSRILLRQDKVSYAEELRMRITLLVEDVLSVVDQMYGDFGRFPLNEGALEQLLRNSELAKFQAFLPTTVTEQ